MRCLLQSGLREMGHIEFEPQGRPQSGGNSPCRRKEDFSSVFVRYGRVRCRQQEEKKEETQEKKEETVTKEEPKK